MRNVTVLMDGKVARWVRIEAARHDMSVSRFLAELVDVQSGLGHGFTQILRIFTDQNLPSRNGGLEYRQ